MKRPGLRTISHWLAVAGTCFALLTLAPALDRKGEVSDGVDKADRACEAFNDSLRIIIRDSRLRSQGQRPTIAETRDWKRRGIPTVDDTMRSVTQRIDRC